MMETSDLPAASVKRLVVRSEQLDLFPGSVEDKRVVCRPVHGQPQTLDNLLTRCRPVPYLIGIQQHGNGFQLKVGAGVGGSKQAMKPEAVKRPGITEYLPREQLVQVCRNLRHRCTLRFQGFPGDSVNLLGTF